MGLPSELAFVFGDTPSVFQRTRLIAREMIAENTLALTIERPGDFTFEAGQNTTISLPGKHADDLREFTMASAPHEKDLMIAMRIRNSEFKNACYALRPGDAISVRTAAGSLWQQTAEPQVWLSGGIGITPFRSIIRHLRHLGAPISVTHIHSDHSRGTAPFLTEFEAYASENNGFEFRTTMTQESTGDLQGRISAEMIASVTPGYRASRFFIVGTDAFTGAMHEALARLGISGADVHPERFDGYRR